jgi:NAD+ kinase
MTHFVVKINPFSESARDAVSGLVAQITTAGASVRLQDDDASAYHHYARIQPISDPADVLLSLGGDGTLLTAGRYAVQAGLPALGINLGRFGFLTEISLPEVPAWLPRLISRDFLIQPRHVLNASLPDGDQYIAVNDFVIREENPVKTSYLSFAIDGTWFNHLPADGLIVASPTGSTAYNLSSGGSILSPDLSAFILCLICPHILNFRPIVLHAESVVSLVSASPLVLVADGQFSASIPPDTILQVRVHDAPLRLVRLKSLPFPEVLKRKFGWGIANDRQYRAPSFKPASSPVPEQKGRPSK